jgi:hypothetical protein
MIKIDVYDLFGQHAEAFLLRRFGLLKDAAERMKTSPSMLSQIHHGFKPPTKKYEQSMKALGFDMALFEKLKGYHEIVGEGLGWEEIKLLYLELKQLLEEKNMIIKQLEEHVRMLKDKRFIY